MAALAEANAYRDVRPVAPARPLLSRIERGVGDRATVSSILDLPHVAWFSNCRSAIAHAAMLAGVDSGSTVLVPAYHCESMVAPLAWVGASIAVYRIRNDLSIDVDHLLSVSDARTRLVLVPQYFGHQRSTAELHRVAQASGWTLVEDRAHAFFEICKPDVLGADSDFLVASAPKFFAAFDGGILASRFMGVDWPKPQSPSLAAELRAWAEATEYAFEYGRLPVLSSLARPGLRALGSLRRLFNSSARGSVTQPASRYGGIAFEPEHVNLGATMLAKRLARRADRAAIAAIRRRNWSELRERIGASVHLRFPIDCLGPHDVPYVIPVEIPKPELVFPELKRRGVPVYRWESSFGGCDDSACDVSRRYRRTLVQLPCHQSLTSAERDWIARSVLDVVQTI